MRLLWISAGLAFLLDQFTKNFVFYTMNLVTEEVIDVLPPYLVLRKGMNTGVNFGLFADSAAGQRWILIALSIVLCLMLWYWARRNYNAGIEYISAGLVIGGALGNAFDRLIYPGVLDFLNMSCCGIDNPYVFNLADVFIFAGAMGLVFFGGEGRRGENAS
ncbi:signal peptidase II [Aliiruegeria haliotis]|uniref:Lipoprotein signal peptidase n=1 Tax=Aliiruegeria haliotis TaxID=1280846 RepID=A0A2T0RSZ0_9RHOB|nr:signal peptidase II [Aliiruegeria haliotis]PRY24319.1 signal peptidase II [Aliiruegeria haliotis]